MDRTEKQRRLARGTAVHGIVNILKVAVQIVMLPLMARLLGPREYGLYSLAMPTVLFVAMLADGGLGATLAREPEDNAEVWSSGFWMLLGSGAFFAVGLIFWSFILADLTHEPRLPPIMMVLSLCLLLYVLSVPSNALLIRQGRIGVGPIADVFGNLTGAVVAVILGLSGAGAWSLVWQAVIGYSVRTAVAIFSAPVRPMLHMSLKDLRPHLFIGGAVIGVKLIDIGGRAVENALVGRGLGSIGLGSFSLANQIPRFLCESVLNALWTNLFVQALGSNDRSIRSEAYRNLARIAASALFPAAAVISAEGKTLIFVFLGAEWIGMSPLFELLIVTYSLTVIGTLGSALLYAEGRASIQLRITAQAAIIRIASVLISPWTGIISILIGLPLANLYIFWRSLTLSCLIIGEKPRYVIKSIIPPAYCAMFTGLACWLLTNVMAPGYISIAVVTMCSFAIYVFFLLLFVRKSILDDMADLNRLIKR
jgi:O-antigen/teichoic acid export membrane protein